MLAFLLLPVIAVSGAFEGGSIGKVEHVSPTHLRCAVQGQSDQDHRNRQANWYYFELSGLPHSSITIDLVDLAGEYNYKAPANSVTKQTRPVYSYDNEHWSHFDDSQVTWDEKELHLTLRFTPQKNNVWIAHVPPYTNRKLAALLDSFRGNPFLEMHVIGRSVEGRGIPLLSITDAKVPSAKKKVVWLMFRQHAWEAGSSWTCDGTIRFLLGNDERARRIRGQFIYRIFPLADPDGVAAGGVRFNKNGYDLNRNWDAIDPRTMPEVAAEHKAIVDWVDSGRRLDLFLSLHNTETAEYLQAPPAYRALGERLLELLKETTTFNPTVRLREAAATTTPGKLGRMEVAQGLFHDRKLPAMLMEQMVDFNSKLGRCPEISDRQEFGAGLVRALAAALE